MKISKIVTLGGVAGLLSLSSQTFAVEEVNIYSYRQPHLIDPMLQVFTNETGIKVNTVYAKKGMVERDRKSVV